MNEMNLTTGEKLMNYFSYEGCSYRDGEDILLHPHQNIGFCTKVLIMSDWH